MQETATRRTAYTGPPGAKPVGIWTHACVRPTRPPEATRQVTTDPAKIKAFFDAPIEKSKTAQAIQPRRIAHGMRGRAPRRATNNHVRGSRRTTSASSSGDDPGGDPPASPAARAAVARALARVLAAREPGTRWTPRNDGGAA